MPAKYISKRDLEDRLSPLTVARILDDDGDGGADTNAVDRVVADAQSYVDARLKGIYSPIPLNKDGGAVPNEVVRVTLDVAHAFMAQRHPEYVRADGMAMLARCHEQLTELRQGGARLDTDDAPEPGRNVGGIVHSGVPNSGDDSLETESFFRNGTGIF